MKTIYAACLSRLGLSQAEAARFHDVSLDTIKGWSSGRRRPASGWSALIDELREYENQIVALSDKMLEQIEASGAQVLEIDDGEADHLARMAMVDLVLSTDLLVEIGQKDATTVTCSARRPN